MRRRLFFINGLAVLLVAVAMGCGKSGPRVYEVTGTVTFDNEPLPTGDIIFYPDEKEYGADAGKIEDGHYKVKVKAGKKTVTIRATRPVPGKKGPMGNEQAVEDYIPARYSDKDKTELSAEVGDGQTEYSFPLKSK